MEGMPEKRSVYLDNAATTPLHPDVLGAMQPYLTGTFGNPSSLYSVGRAAHRAVESAREEVADAIGADAEEIFFTSGGTESDNWAIKGAALAQPGQSGHIITTSIEHHAVLHTCASLKEQGYDITYLPVDRYGRVDPSQVADAIREDTFLISVMTANNEVGTIQPIKEIAALRTGSDILIHTDAVQAAGHIPIDVNQMDVDMLSLSGHKFSGPKGTGVLYIREGTVISDLIHGGAQEKGRRAGTENVPGIVGLGAALSRACRNGEKEAFRITNLRDMLHDAITGSIDGTSLNGHPKIRLPNNLNISFKGLDGEALQMMLDVKGVSVSTGSACSSGDESASHVLMAMGISPLAARSSIRMTLGEENTEDDIRYMTDILPGIVRHLREISPL